MKPAEIVGAFAAEAAKQDALKTAVGDALAIYGRTMEVIQAEVNGYAALCATFGQANLLGALPPEVAAAFQGSLKALQVMWETVSPTPFPDLPDQPAVK